uniref:Outer membrane protein assembly factor BamE domain-containing protein n=1 Tax=Glossina austeni TaxID=7395 RepID=A0A1A9VK56_GLOAU
MVRSGKLSTAIELSNMIDALIVNSKFYNNVQICSIYNSVFERDQIPKEVQDRIYGIMQIMLQFSNPSRHQQAELPQVSNGFFVAAATHHTPKVSCTHTIHNHGAPDISVELWSKIKAGDDKEKVVHTLGSPTLVSKFDDNVWYYVSYKIKQANFLGKRKYSKKVFPESEPCAVLYDNFRYFIDIIKHNNEPWQSHYLNLELLLLTQLGFKLDLSKCAVTVKHEISRAEKPHVVALTLMSSLVKLWNIIISSSLFKNSGRNADLTICITSLFTELATPPSDVIPARDAGWIPVSATWMTGSIGLFSAPPLSIISAPSSSITSGLLSISILTLLAASSIKSIALSVEGHHFLALQLLATFLLRYPQHQKYFAHFHHKRLSNPELNLIHPQALLLSITPVKSVFADFSSKQGWRYRSHQLNIKVPLLFIPYRISNFACATSNSDEKFSVCAVVESTLEVCMAESIWAKIGGAVKTGVKATGQVFALVPEALIYPIKKPFASTGEMKHDATVSLKEAVGKDVPKEKREYDLPIETTQASKDLGVEIISCKDGKVKFLVSRTLTGDISYLNDEQLVQIKKNLPNVTIFREENKIVIEINVEEIANTIKTNPYNKGKSEKEIKELVLKGIADKVDEDLEKLAGITGGEFKTRTDLKLLDGIAKELYPEDDNQNKPSKTLRPAQTGKSPGQSSETVTSTDELVKSFNITNPNEFPFGKSKEAISLIKNMQLSEGDITKQVEGLRSTFLNFEDASGEVIKPLFTPDVERNKGRGKGRS